MFVQAKDAIINLKEVVEFLPVIEERTYEDSTTSLVFNLAGQQCGITKPANSAEYMLAVMTNGSKHLILANVVNKAIH